MNAGNPCSLRSHPAHIEEAFHRLSLLAFPYTAAVVRCTRSCTIACLQQSLTAQQSDRSKSRPNQQYLLPHSHQSQPESRQSIGRASISPKELASQSRASGLQGSARYQVIRFALFCQSGSHSGSKTHDMHLKNRFASFDPPSDMQ